MLIYNNSYFNQLIQIKESFLINKLINKFHINNKRIKINNINNQHIKTNHTNNKLNMSKNSYKIS